ncbi:MAG: hypothetical protein DMG05_01755 [Acidobacteria bacterium]|nr:MAG: hypothetical protein DMG05_01755 [Acidobacteriota bacterium]
METGSSKGVFPNSEAEMVVASKISLNPSPKTEGQPNQLLLSPSGKLKKNWFLCQTVPPA